MFEKFSVSDIDSSGGGGEYTVQAGFGWTNGVVLWVASTYGHVLAAPTCPSILADFASASGSSTESTSAALRLRVPGLDLFLDSNWGLMGGFRGRFTGVGVAVAIGYLGMTAVEFML